MDGLLMNSKKMRVASVAAIVLLQINGQSQAVEPQYLAANLDPCKYDVALYQREVDNFYKKAGRRGVVFTDENMRTVFETLKKQTERAPTVSIVFETTQEKSGADIQVDASGSRTSSGKIEYEWLSYTRGESSGFFHEDSNNPKNTTGSVPPRHYKTLRFGITDPVCGVTEEGQFNVHGK